MLCSGLRLGCWGAGIPGGWREVASVLTDTLWNTGVCNLLGYGSGCCPARASKFAGGPVLTYMGSYEFGPRAGLMGIRSLGLTCAECIVCWLLSCHLEAISIEMVSAVCCVLGVARGSAQHSPGSGSQEPFTSCMISSLKSSEALPSRPSSGSSGPLLSLPLPPLLELKSSDPCGGKGRS